MLTMTKMKKAAPKVETALNHDDSVVLYFLTLIF